MVLLLLSLCVSATTWLYVNRVLEPWSETKQQQDRIKAQMWDLYPRWLGTRELLLHQQNPYGTEVTHEIQIAFYGHIIAPEGSTSRVIDEQRFAYPIYVVFLMAPTIYLDFATVKFWAPFALGVFAAFTVLLSIDLLDWRLPWSQKAALVLFVLSSPQIVQGMHHQQLALVVAFLLAVGAWCVHRGSLRTAGAVLAFSTIKPQMALLPIAWFLIWSAGGWRARWRLLAAFSTSLAIMIGAGEFLLPGWIGDFIDAMAAYRRYFPTTSLLRLLLGDRVGIFLGFVIVTGVLSYGWRNRKAGGDSRQFVFMFAVFLMATLLAFPLFIPFNQALLILPALLLVHDWEEIPTPSRIVFAGIVCWPWVLSLALLLRRPLSPMSGIQLLPGLAEHMVPLLLPVLLYPRRKAVHTGAPNASVSS